jgi:hypothetical protein
MESISRNIHILNILGSIQGRELQSKLARMIGLNP